MKPGDSQAPQRRPHKGVLFKCCQVYAHIYLNAKGDAFIGFCPRCAGKLELRVDPDGSEANFFEAG